MLHHRQFVLFSSISCLVVQAIMPAVFACQIKTFAGGFATNLSDEILSNSKLLIHSYRWEDSTTKSEPIIFRRDHAVENKRAGLGGKTWKLIDAKTLQVGEVIFTPDRTGTILIGRIGNKLNSYIFLDRPGEKILTPDQAESAVTRYFLKSKGGFSAKWSTQAALCFPTGVDMKGFAREGDHIWQVHLHSLGKFHRPIGVYWVNGRTGEVRPVEVKLLD